MPVLFRKLLLCALIPVVMPVSAQFADDDLQLSEMARVVTNIARPEECLAAITVTTVDGAKEPVSAQGFLIEPGLHRLNGKAMLDTTHCPITDRNLQPGRAEDLEFNFEPGNTYYIGYYHKPENPAEWKLVVWNTETP